MASDEKLARFIASIPNFDVFIKLRIEREKDKDREVEHNDIRDLDWLSVAVPYSNVVVSEQYWGKKVQATGLADTYNRFSLPTCKNCRRNYPRLVAAVDANTDRADWEFPNEHDHRQDARCVACFGPQHVRNTSATRSATRPQHRSTVNRHYNDKNHHIFKELLNDHSTRQWLDGKHRFRSINDPRARLVKHKLFAGGKRGAELGILVAFAYNVT